MSLYKAETRRLVKRRFTKLFVLGVLLVLAAVAAGMFFTNQKLGPDQVAGAQAQAQAQFQQAVERTKAEKVSCEAARGTATESQWPPDCQLYEPTTADFDPKWYMPATFDFREQFPDMVTTLAALTAVVALIVGASFVGAEWSSGGMMNLLLWRPRRIQVLTTKLAAFLVAVTVLSVVVSAVWTGVFMLIAQSRGSTDGMTPGAWQSIGLMELRGLAVVVVAGALGFGLATIGRRTAMALGAVIGVIIVFQFGLGTVLAMAKVPFAQAYLIPVWVEAWMMKSSKVEDYNSCDFSGVNGCTPDSVTITWPVAGGVMAAVFVAIVGTALWTIRSRDIT